MNRRLLITVLSAVLLAAPAAARGALVVSGPSPALGATGTTTIEVESPTPAARIVVLAPLGFTASLGQAPGTPVGSASAKLRLGGSEVEVAGALVAGDPAGAACEASGHDAIWRLGDPGELLVAVDAVAPSDADGGRASYRLEACSGQSGLLASLELRLEDVVTNPHEIGEYVWRAVAVPADAAGAPVADAAVESRSTQLLPVQLTLHGSFDRAGGVAILTGALTAAGRPLSGVDVTFAAGQSGSSLVRAGSVATGSQGKFHERRPLSQTTVFGASAETPARVDPRGCPDPIAAGGCVSATLAPVSVTSARVVVRVPAPRILRLGSRGADVRRLKAELARLRFLPPGSRGARFDERTWHAVVALQGWRGLARTGVVDRRTWRALALAPAPRPWARLRRGVLIDTARQVMLLVEGGRTVRAIHVSTGAYGRTPRGRFAVYRKETLSWSVPFGVWMPYASYFHGGFAMHAYPSVPSYPASHGCVRIPPVEAPGVYSFARYGTPVWVR
jgi:L,D-transpeptidase catalytic domain/Putative peptidoglycan binding domain